MKIEAFPAMLRGFSASDALAPPDSAADTARGARHSAARHYFGSLLSRSARDVRESPSSSTASSGSVVAALGLVLALTVVGDAVAEALAVPVPGAAIGMMMLAGVFALRGGIDPASGRIFDASAPYFPLFFVPAAAGIVANMGLLASAWFSVVVAIVFGTAVTLTITGALAQLLLRRFAKGTTV